MSFISRHHCYFFNANSLDRLEMQCRGEQVGVLLLWLFLSMQIALGEGEHVPLELDWLANMTAYVLIEATRIEPRMRAGRE